MTHETDSQAVIREALPGLLRTVVLTLGAVVALALCAVQMRSCEVERSKAWRESRTAQTASCAESCPGGFAVHFEEGTQQVRCVCD